MEILQLLESHLTAEMLRYHAGQTIFCPGCERVLDWRSSVSIDVQADGKVVWTRCLCAPCSDRYLPGFAERLRGMLPGIPAEAMIVVTTTDGRDFDDEDNYSPPPQFTLGAQTRFNRAHRDQPAGQTMDCQPISGLPAWADFVTYQTGSRWHVCERATGYSVGSGDTPTDAFKQAWRRLNSAGQEKFNRMLSGIPILNP